jgi:prepilin-type N-terminal cleavage/methylation domain-containing protein
MKRLPYQSSKPKRGFTLIEVMVSISFLGLTLMLMAPVTMRVARLSTFSTVATQRAAVLAGEVQRLEQVDFADLTEGTTCFDKSASDFPHQKCIRVTTLNPTTRRLVVIVTPIPGRGDSVQFDKTSGSRYNPLAQ